MLSLQVPLGTEAISDSPYGWERLSVGQAFALLTREACWAQGLRQEGHVQATPMGGHRGGGAGKRGVGTQGPWAAVSRMPPSVSRCDVCLAGSRPEIGPHWS